VAALRAGCTVAVLDAGQQPGGQYWRHPPGDLTDVADRATFTGLAEVVRSRATYLPDHEVWTAGRDGDAFVVHAVHRDAATTVRGSTLVLAPGSYDRQLPFPGWDLPGVYTAGGAQALLKGHRVTVGRSVVVGGTGPFLLPVAAGLAAHGVSVQGVFEANHPAAWVRRLPAMARNPGRLVEAAGYAAMLARFRIPYRSRHAIVAAHGTEQVESVTVARLDRGWGVVPGTARTVRCDAVAVGWGFVPRLELPLALGCSTLVDIDGSLTTAVDDDQATDVPGVYVAGEACGVGGATLAVVEGELAGVAAAARLGRRVGDVGRLTRRRARLRAFAAAMHSVYPVADGWRQWLRPDTLVCRCEEVPVSSITEAMHALGASDVRSVKLLTRSGMGWCQGRVCSYPTSRLVAADVGGPADERGLAERPLAVPVSLELLARLPSTDQEADDDRIR